MRHGIPEDRMYGVKVADLKVIAKGIKGQQSLALELFGTGNIDAMYLAGLVADGRKMSKRELNAWVRGARGLSTISEYTVPWVAVESPYARELALRWIVAGDESTAASGWCTYTGIVATTPDGALDLAEIERLLAQVVAGIDTAPNRVRYTMNGFVIAVGAYVEPLFDQAKQAAASLGRVSVEMGQTACKVPVALAYIEKIESMQRVGKKRKTIRC